MDRLRLGFWAVMIWCFSPHRGRHQSRWWVLECWSGRLLGRLWGNLISSKILCDNLLQIRKKLIKLIECLEKNVVLRNLDIFSVNLCEMCLLYGKNNNNNKLIIIENLRRCDQQVWWACGSWALAPQPVKSGAAAAVETVTPAGIDSDVMVLRTVWLQLIEERQMSYTLSKIKHNSGM